MRINNDPILKAKELVNILKYFKSIKTINLPRGMKCPLDIEIEDKEADLTHYELSQAVAGLGFIRWNCPFCGEHFED